MKTTIRHSCRRLLAAAALLLAALLATPAALAQATVTYFHNDVAGTPWLATSQAGALLWKENYLPYGYPQKAEPASADNKLWFAGRPYDPDTGMTYMGARYYMPLLGRFTGMDPKEVNPEQIHSFNRYAYANNNPNRYIDPDGKLAETVWDAFNISLGFQSLVSNVLDGNWSGAVVDAAGIAVDGVAAAIPVVPGGVGASVAAYRAADGAKGVGALGNASDAAFRAVERAEGFSVPLKHLPNAAGNWSKFAEGVNPNDLIREALSSRSANFFPNASEGSYKIVTDLGRPIGSKGETSLRVVIGQDGKIWTAFPVK